MVDNEHPEEADVGLEELLDDLTIDDHDEE